MCGGAGHLKDECPNSKCLKCGNPQEFYSNRGCVQCKRLSDADCFNCGGRGKLIIFFSRLAGNTVKGLVYLIFGNLEFEAKQTSARVKQKIIRLLR